MPLRLNFCHSKTMCLFHNCLLSNSGLNPVVRSMCTSDNKILPVTNVVKRFQEIIAGSLIQLTSWNHPGFAQMQKKKKILRWEAAPVSTRLWVVETFRKRELVDQGERSRGSCSLQQKYKGLSIWSMETTIQKNNNNNNNNPISKEYNSNIPQVCYFYSNNHFLWLCFFLPMQNTFLTQIFLTAEFGVMSAVIIAPPKRQLLFLCFCLQKLFSWMLSHCRSC